MELKDCRQLFVGTKDKVFLDAACVGLAPITAKEKIVEFLDMAITCPARDASEHHVHMDDLKERALNSAAKLFNAPTDHVTLIESTTHGLNIAAHSIQFNKDDEIILCDTEYLQVAIPFVKIAEKHGLKIVPLKVPKSSHASIEDFARLVTKKTKALCLSSVQWCTGQRIFTKAISDLCRAHNIWLIIDGVQEAGALDIDVNNRPCDFYIAGGHKWLNAPYGCGIMYMSKKALGLEAPTFGYLNLDAPPGGWGQYFRDPTQTPFRNYDFPAKARSFSIGGTGNYPGAIGLEQSMNIVHQIGIKNVEKRVLELSRLLKSTLQRLNVHVIGNHNDESLSGITMFSVHNDPHEDLACLNQLLQQRILLSVRYTNGHGGIRASTHYYNNEEDIDQLCNTIKTFTGSSKNIFLPISQSIGG